MTWRAAYSLNVLRDEIDVLAPDRSTLSDGTVGDLSHSARPSDHNPNAAGVVRARDITHDPANGCDCNALTAEIARLLGNHPALGSGAYLIWRRRIISTDRLAEGWRTYTGSNPHDKHMHVSVGTRGYDDLSPWLEEEDDMPFTDEDRTRLERIERLLDRLTVAEKRREVREQGDDADKGEQLDRIEG